MVTLVAILPERNQMGVSFLKTIADAYPEHVQYMEISDIGDLPDDKPIVFFHPRKIDNNPKWLPPEKVEDFLTADLPEDSYWVVNADYGSDITDEVENKAHYLIDKARWVKIEVTTNQEFKSLHGHQAMAIAFWVRYFKPKL